jgi:hypothetical protein
MQSGVAPFSLFSPARLSILLTFVVLAAGLNQACPAATAPANIRNPEEEGKALANRLRNMPPEENSQVHGVLEILPRTGPPQFIPVTCTIKLTTNGWQVAYTALGTNAASGQAGTLSIFHTPGEPSVYRWTASTNAKGSAGSPVELTQPFVGTDFWVQDLGLEFLHWPQQRILRAEMSRGRACRILESSQPKPAANGYVRVLSWVDLETGGIIQAEAYDAAGKLLKKFKLGSFGKVEGQWRLRNMRISSPQTGSQTDLKFELNRPAAAP